MNVKCFSVALLLSGWACEGLNADAPPDDETTFLRNVRQLTYEGRRAGEGYFSPDGNALIFQSEREPKNPFFQIYILNLETGDSHRVSPGIGKTTCAFFRPGSDEVLFASTHHDPQAQERQQEELAFRASGQERRYSWDYDVTMDIFSSHRDGSGLKRLTESHGYDAEGSYSPDGSKIVFCSLRDVYAETNLTDRDRKLLEIDPSCFGEIYIMNSDGSNQRRLTHSPGYDGGPFFSPAGDRIIWRRFTEDGATADVYTMNLDGSDVRRLTDFDSMAWAPYFHPSGEYAVFTSNKHGFANFELFVVDAHGGKEPVRVTFADGFDGLPVFSPDGKRLAWTSNRYAANPTSADKGQLFIGDWDHDAALAALSNSERRSGASDQEVDRGISAATSFAKPPGVPTPKTQRAIDIEDMRTDVSYLASDELEGRMTGGEGIMKAARYIEGRLKRAGIEPLGDAGSFFQPFEYTSGVKVVEAGNAVSIHHGSDEPPTDRFSVGTDFRPLALTENGEVEGEVVFAGYGLRVPGKLGEGYDSYAGLNVSNRIALVLRYVPEEVEPKRRAELNRYAGLRYKAMIAREQGAKAILVVTGPNSPNSGKLAPLSFDTSLSASGIIAMSVTERVAASLLARSGKTLKELQTALDTENPHAIGGLELPEVRARITAKVEHVRSTDRNVVGFLRPGVDSADREYVVIGAHYDHLGRGETGGFNIKGEENEIHNGADDNASGVSTVIEIAETLATLRSEQPSSFKRGIVFAFWSGEELGLIGSSRFVDDAPIDLTRVAAYVNFDMVGRLRENKLILQGIGSSSAWKRLIEKRNVAAGFQLNLQDDPYLPTDTTPFYPKQIPVLAFFTGSHEEYHRPSDDVETVNFDGMQRIANFARGIVYDLVKADERPDYLTVEKSSQGGSRDTMRAYLGTIPDYTTEVEGVKLTGVRAGGPADKGGLKGDDVIVEFGGQEIKNIYDYTYALDAVKVGVPIKVVVDRKEGRVELSVTPEARR